MRIKKRHFFKCNLSQILWHLSFSRTEYREICFVLYRFKPEFDDVQTLLVDHLVYPWTELTFLICTQVRQGEEQGWSDVLGGCCNRGTDCLA